MKEPLETTCWIVNDGDIDPEWDEMKYASPATVSRLGMIFLSEEDVDVGRITMTWLEK